MTERDDATFKVITELPDGPDRQGESEACSTLDTANVKVHRYRCECYTNEVTVRGVVYSYQCSCSRVLQPLKSRSGAADIARQLGPRAPDGSSLITPRSDDTNRTTAPAWQQVEDDGEPTYNATEVSQITGYSDQTIIRRCKAGTILGADQPGGPGTNWEIPQRGLSALLRELKLKQQVSDNVGSGLA